MIEKLVKEFEKIRASLAKSKKLIVADIDKIDEKYRTLAQEEKKSLTENLAILNEQLKYYDKMLTGQTVVEETSEESTKEEQEAVIEDTIFPENNEPEEEKVKEDTPAVEEKTEEVAEEPESEDKGMTQEEIVKTLEDAGFVNIDTVVKEENEEDAPAQLNIDENDWPIPDDWK